MCCLNLVLLLAHAGDAGPGVSLFTVAGLVLFVLAILVLVVAVVISRAASRRREGDGEVLTGDPAREVILCAAAQPALLSPGELRFYQMLAALVSPRCYVFAKVRLADLFLLDDCPCRPAAIGILSGKRIDFVLCDPSSSGVLAAIELDENAVEEDGRVERERFVDDLFSSNGLPLIRVPEGVNGDDQALKQSLSRHELLPTRAGGLDAAEPAGV